MHQSLPAVFRLVIVTLEPNSAAAAFVILGELSLHLRPTGLPRSMQPCYARLASDAGAHTRCVPGDCDDASGGPKISVLEPGRRGQCLDDFIAQRVQRRVGWIKEGIWIEG